MQRILVLVTRFGGKLRGGNCAVTYMHPYHYCTTFAAPILLQTPGATTQHTAISHAQVVGASLGDNGHHHESRGSSFRCL